MNPFAKALGAKPATPVADSKPNPLVAAFAKAKPLTQPTQATKPVSVESTDLASLDDLASQFESATVVSAPRKSQFADEVPATAPMREIPADVDAGTQAFIDQMDQVYALYHDPELLAGVITSIMIELKEYPQYAKHITKLDAMSWVRAMRENMGLARVKKAEKKAGTRKSGSKAATDADMLAAFDDLGISLDSLS